MIKAIVFDFDGLILETERPQSDAWGDIYRSYGEELPKDAWLEVMGKPVKIDLFPRRLAKILGRDLDIDAVIAEYRQVVAKRLAEQPVQPGVLEVIRDAQNAGIKIAVASGSSHRWVDGHLTRLGLLDHFAYTICAEDTERHKPDPDPYQHACDRLGVSPADSLALEDNALGVAAAKAAGMRVIAVPTAMTAYQSFDDADLVLDSLDQMPLSEMIHRLDAGRGQP